MKRGADQGPGEGGRACAARARGGARPVLIAPDKFKGTITATRVADAIAAGLAEAGVEADVCPVADGGEGTLDMLLEIEDGERVAAAAHDALGRPIAAEFAVVRDGRVAIVEVARAIGLQLIDESERDAWSADSRGAGELIARAASTGATEVIVAIGGTASTDGGAGAIAALEEAGLAAAHELPTITVLCDSRVAWEQAAPTFAPQKGADPALVDKLRQRMARLATGARRDPTGVPFTGCGGGLAGTLWASFDATLAPGAAYLLDRVEFTPRMRAARAVITGEGRLDHQTLTGKAVGEIATRARQAGVPCHAIVGQNRLGRFETRLLDIESVTEAGEPREISAAASKLAAALPPA